MRAVMLWGKVSSQFFDEILPTYVKSTYIPNKAWKSKPFGEEDIRFFSKGLAELSDSFTDDRERFRKSPNLYGHARFRSAYLLYYFPLQASKFRWVLDRHGMRWLSNPAGLQTLELWDWGAGSGTASFAFLFWLLESHPEVLKNIKTLRMIWVEPERALVQDGKNLMAELLKALGPSAPTVDIQTIYSTLEHFDVGRAGVSPPSSTTRRLSLFGHVWNEGLFQAPRSMELAQQLVRLTDNHTLFVEPAAPGIAQWLSQVRDRMIEMSASHKLPATVIGPCLHQGKCPLARGRNWCHFSTPAKLELKVWQALSRTLGPVREYIKCSYLFMGGATSSESAHGAPVQADPNDRLVISDIIPGPSPHVLLCEPDRAREHPMPPLVAGQKRPPMRGTLIKFRSPSPQKNRIG